MIAHSAMAGATGRRMLSAAVTLMLFAAAPPPAVAREHADVLGHRLRTVEPGRITVRWRPTAAWAIFRSASLSGRARTARARYVRVRATTHRSYVFRGRAGWTYRFVIVRRAGAPRHARRGMRADVVVRVRARATPAREPYGVVALTRSTFANPPAIVRPKYRWWLTLAQVDDDELRREVHDMAAAGAGSVEITPFPIPASTKTTTTSPYEIPTDPQVLKEDGWGTPKWAHKLAVVLRAAAEEGITVDQNMGPYYPPIVPTVTDINDPAVQQQLLYGSTVVGAGATYSGAVPAPATAAPAGARTRLVAVSVARCTQPRCAGSPVTLDPASARAITPTVADGKVTFTAPSDGDYELVAFWQSPDGQHLSGFTATGTNYVLDHLSTASVDATKAFWDTYVFTPEVRALYAKTGPGDVFEDSLELSGTVKFTGDFVEQFAQRRGYDVAKWLPAVAGSGNRAAAAGAFEFSGDVGARVREDWRQTFSDLYTDRYLTGLRRWLNARGLRLRAQAYGAPIELGQAASALDSADGESLAFGPNLDGYKFIAAGGHASGSQIMSTECCASLEATYTSTMAGPSSALGPLAGIGATGLLVDIYRAYAGGMTQQIWHGFDYRDSANAAWPGYHAWSGPENSGEGPDFAEALGPRNPQWADTRAVNVALGRVQLALRQGLPAFDVAVYSHAFPDFGIVGGGNATAAQLGADNALQRHGLTYEYVSSARFDGPPPTFRDGELFPGSGGYRGVLLNQQSTMSARAAERLLALARGGLPIVVVGAPPNAAPGAGEDDALVKSLGAQLVEQPSVKLVSTLDAVPEALRGLGVTPSTQRTPRSSAIQGIRRVAPDADYYFLYNTTDRAATATMTLAGHGRPYRLDQWTGQVTPIAAYTSSGRDVTMRVDLPARDGELVALSTKDLGEPAPAAHVVSTTGDAVVVRDGRLYVRAAKGGTYKTTLSDGRSITTTVGDVPAAGSPTDWTLSLESWTPEGTSAYATRKTTLPAIPLRSADGSLPSWTALPGLQSSSGIGTYTTTVAVPGGVGATLDLGKAVDTVAVKVNGKPVAVDQADPNGIDIGRQLVAGANTIEVRVASTLLNAARAVPLNADWMQPKAPQLYGLQGPVRLVPYREAELA